MKKAAALLVLALTSVALVACGSSSDSSSSSSTATTEASTPQSVPPTGGAKGGGETIKLEADPGGQLAYTTDAVSAKAGNVTIDFNNPQALTHDVAVEDSSGETVGETDLIEEGSTSAQLSNLKPGTYTYFCTVPGHREAGMEGTLTVK